MTCRMRREVHAMRPWTKASLLLLLTAAVVGCVNETEMRKRDARDFLQKSTGEYTNEAGAIQLRVHAAGAVARGARAPGIADVAAAQ